MCKDESHQELLQFLSLQFWYISLRPNTEKLTEIKAAIHNNNTDAFLSFISHQNSADWTLLTTSQYKQMDK